MSDEDRDAIVRRRAALVAAALVGLVAAPERAEAAGGGGAGGEAGGGQGGQTQDVEPQVCLCTCTVQSDREDGGQAAIGLAAIAALALGVRGGRRER